MTRLKRIKIFIAIPIFLAASLMTFNFFVPFASAEGDTVASEQGGIVASSDPSAATNDANTNTGQSAESGTQVTTGDVNVDITAGNAVNTNATSVEATPAPTPGPTSAPTPDLAATPDQTPTPAPTPTPDPDAISASTPSATPDSALASTLDSNSALTPTPDPAASPAPDPIATPDPDSASASQPGDSPVPEPSAAPLAETPDSASSASARNQSSRPEPTPDPSPTAADDAATPTPTPTPAETPTSADDSSIVPNPNEETAPSQESASTGGTSAQITNNNEASVGNNVAAEGNSGSNAAGGQGDAAINTGNVNVVVGLVNTVNTNITGSDFAQFLFNIFKNSAGEIDLSGKIGGAPQADCSPSGGCLSALDNANTNQGTIENNLSISASSGDNKANSGSGNAVIRTGDANVAASIFNLLNTNIIFSSWHNLIINIFDNWTGDLVFPGKDKMQEFMDSSGQGGLCGENCGISVNNTSNGQIVNSVQQTADTGGNQAIGDSAIINTGNANSKTNLFNVANTNLIGNNWFFVVINNLGSWEGRIFSLPPGFKIAGDFGAIKIYNVAPEDLAGENPASAASGGTNLAGAQSDNPEGGNALTIKNNNSGIIKNNVTINASTGANSAVSSGGAATIQTGNANALTNIVNILNSNIIHGNLFFGMINIFGTWKGDLAFGRPDLWVGASAAAPSNPSMPGDLIIYTLTYANKGNADATEVTVWDDFDERYFSIIDSGGGAVSDNTGEIQWNLGTVPAGGTGSVSYTAAVRPEIPYGGSSFTSEAAIASIEKDGNSQDNTDEVSTEVYKISPRRRPPNFLISETHSGEGFVYSGGQIDYKIVLLNDSNSSAYDVLVNSTLLDGSGKVFNASSWNLGEVFPHEEIIIEYTLVIGSEIPAGFYASAIQAEGFDIYGDRVESILVSSPLEIKEKVKEKETIVPPKEEIAPETSAQAADEPAREPKKQISAAPRKKTIASSVKEILGAEASAKETADLSGADNGKNTETLANDYLAAIRYRDALAVSLSLIILLVSFYFIEKRREENQL